jgi:hypothetical protein
LRQVFTIGLGRLQSGGRYAQGNIEATLLPDNAMMYISSRGGSVDAMDCRVEKKIKWRNFDPGIDWAWAGDVGIVQTLGFPRRLMKLSGLLANFTSVLHGRSNQDHTRLP